LDFQSLRSALSPSPLVSLAAAMMLLGLLVKASLFPLHFWLPPTHAGALGPASALLSAVVVKGPFYAALRLWFDVFPEIATAAAGQCIGALGAGGILWGAAQALRSKRLKQIIAYSTVSQMGYLFLLFPLLTGPMATAWATTAWTGGIYQAMSHALAKAALLMAAGVTLYSLGSDHLRSMRGLAGQLPITTFTIALACVSLMGLPPSGGFIGKWLLLAAALESGQWWWAPVLLVGGLLTAGYVFLMLSYAFQPKEGEPMPRRPRPLMELTALALALASILIGLRVEEPMRLLDLHRTVAIAGEVQP
jgi:multicomponent Na+:H+ antiporter subunit D